MSINDKLVTAIRNYLRIKDPQGLSIEISQILSFEAEIFKNRIWYRGEPNELQEFYSNVDDKTGNQHFWSAKPTKGLKIRKIHTGLPGLIVEVLTNVCLNDLYDITLSDRQDEWDEIAKDNKFNGLLKQCVSRTLALGDGAFKFSYAPEVSKYPIIEFFDADRVDFIYDRGRLIEVIFKTKKMLRNNGYVFKEHYRKESITYTLENASGKEVDINSFPELAEYQPIKNNAGFIPAVPVIFNPSTKHEGRGQSIFSGKYDNFDSLDEVYSQWMLAVRKGQIKEYIPRDFLSRNPFSGAVMQYNDFDNDFIMLEEDGGEGATNKIETTQGIIQHEALLASYVTALDLCLQGVISPSTLGIDVKKLDNAEAQREKEKTTLYTRNKVLDTLDDVIKAVVITALKFSDTLQNKSTDENIKVTVSHGGYANPSFEAQIETISKASAANIMSTEACVDELYGNDKDEEWKAEEVKRIKEEKGIIEADEPSIGDEIFDNEE